jgi:hypothetical protein
MMNIYRRIQRSPTIDTKEKEIYVMTEKDKRYEKKFCEHQDYTDK